MRASPRAERDWIDRAIERVVPRVRAAELSPHGLEPVCEDIWFHERELGSTWGPRLPTRMAIVRLSCGALWIWSPLPPEPTLLETIATMGRIRVIVAPSTFHHLWAYAFAEASGQSPELWCAPGVARKNPMLRSASVLDADAKPSWADEFEWVLVGPLGSFCEVLLLHHRSSTLFVADLAFHLMDMPRAIDRGYWSLYGAYGGFQPSFLMRRFLRRDAARAGDALCRAASWPLKRILVAHGTPIENAACAQFRRAFRHWIDR